MKNIIGDLFTVNGFDAKAITTNGFLKANGEAVMGRGCALKAKQMHPVLPKTLGSLIKHNGNQPQLIWSAINYSLISFPVKPCYEFFDGSNAVKHMKRNFEIGQRMPGWACKARLEIISQSAHQLVRLANHHEWDSVLLPRAGCGNGELSWEFEVKPILSKILDGRFTSISFKNGGLR